MKTKEIANNIRSTIKSGFFKGVGIGAGLLTTSIFAAAAAMNVFSPGGVVSSSQINQNFLIAAPEGAVVAFYLDSCPTGWAPADGTNGTPDMRGLIVRGRNDVGTGARSDTWEDPTGSRAKGDLQLDAFQGHRHEPLAPSQNFWGSGSGSTLGTGGSPVAVPATTGDPVTDGTNGGTRTANETRPKNIALTYCMRKES